MCDVLFDKKIALYINDKKITDYIYNWGKKSNGIACMGKDDYTIDVYDLENEKIKFSIEGAKDASIKKDTIVITTQYDMKCIYDFNGNVILSPRYIDIFVKNDYYIVTNSDKIKELYKKENDIMKRIISSEVEASDIRLCNEGTIIYSYISKVKYCGVYSYEGKEIVPVQYKSIDFRKTDIIVKASDDNIGIYSYSGRQLISAEYKVIVLFNNCYIVGKQINYHNYYGLYTKTGKKVLSPRYEEYRVTLPFIYFDIAGKKCLYNLYTGKRVLPLKYRHIVPYFNVIYASEDNKKYSLHSGENGDLITNELYDRIEIYDLEILRLKRNHECDVYYLVRHNAFVDADKYKVLYNQNDNKIYIMDPSSTKNTDLYSMYKLYTAHIYEKKD